ncbi:MAG TPA: class I SAM-dependent methyltransferase [Tenuifilaceae bacterium]|nr:class I SAM-dependent methyltransferase [Tenuifilaceae bacterium]
MYKHIAPEIWDNYELIDSGNGEKLERFGSQVLARPEPQALWDKKLNPQEWQQKANAYFIKKKGSHEKENEWGEWKLKPKTLEQWTIDYNLGDSNLKFRLGLTNFKHVGIFPEQASNWNFIYSTIKKQYQPNYSVLNLFAYTGGASLAAKAAGATVTHVDSIKQVVNWARENMEHSNLSNIRWIVDDAVKFVNREVRRGNKYNAIILDPPAYGRGTNGEKWILEEDILDLLKQCQELLLNNNGFVLLNLYSMGFSPTIAENLVNSVFNVKSIESGELCVIDSFGRQLPLGIFSRAII